MRAMLALGALLAAVVLGACGGRTSPSATTTSNASEAPQQLRAAPIAPSAKDAPRSPKKAIWGPVQVDGVSQFPIYRQLGVGIFQYALYWTEVTQARPKDPTDPADPAYNWPAELDRAVAEAGRYGIDVAIQVLRTPAWANEADADLAGPQHDRTTIPPRDPQVLADFFEALARRYPTVHLFMVGSEPIRYQQYYVQRSRFLETNPNAAQRKQIGGYAQEVDAVYGRLKSLSRRNKIIGGNTTTTGNISAFGWIRNLKLPNGKPPRMDYYGHNPFSTRTPDLSQGQAQSESIDFSDLDVLHRLLRRNLQRDGRNRDLKVFISEYSSPTDAPSYEFPYHVTRAVQARWLQAAFGIVRREPWIAALGWASLYDRPRGGDPNYPTMSSNTGLIDADGVRKPSFSVYQRARP